MINISERHYEEKTANQKKIIDIHMIIEQLGISKEWIEENKEYGKRRFY